MDAGPIGTQRTIAERQRALMRWYRAHGRHHLPWRHTRDPYAILVSEVMLQQTQVDRVIPYWTAWMRRWPTIAALARVKRASVIRAWAGLGYNRRAVYLHQLAQDIVRNGWPGAVSPFVVRTVDLVVQKGERPYMNLNHRIARAARDLQRLSGIGPYTAHALLAFAWNLPAPCVDTNVRRVLAYAIFRRPAIMRMPFSQVMRLAVCIIPRGSGRDWNYALMDYGALVLRARDVPKRPNSEFGRLRKRTEKFEGSDRFWRGRIVAALAASRRPTPLPVLRRMLVASGEPPPELDPLLDALARDGVVRRVVTGYRLA